MDWKSTARIKFLNRTTLFYCLSIFFFFFFSVCALSTTNSASLECIYSPLTGKSDLHFQEPDFHEKGKDGGDMIVPIIGRRRSARVSLSLTRRYLSGPGSWPPRCTSKCGSCRPCKPVHVPVPPGTPVTAEYYPEAWRCKCGNKLYMP